jgi:hypothetical protein
VSAVNSPIAEFIAKYERTFSCDGFEIPYLFVPGTHYQDNLCVIFSAFNDEKSPLQLTYNYVRTLMNFEGRKLFILDNVGPRGGYYIGKAPDFKFGDAVHALIEKIREEIGVARDHVICVGGSKGGTAALYHGLKGEYGSVISGAPQVKISSYLMNCAQETYGFMFGDGVENENLGNNVILDLCRSKSDTNITLISSPNDWQYKEHVLPFIIEAQKNQLNCRVLIDKEGKEHNDIANFFLKNLCRLVVETIIQQTKSIWHLDLEDYLRGYIAMDVSNFNRSKLHLNVTEGRIVYLHTFDGNFNAPGSNEYDKRMSQIPSGYNHAVVTLDQEFSSDSDFTLFLIQFTKSGKDSVVRTSKAIKATMGLIKTEMPVAVDPQAISFKVALRYKSNLPVEVDIDKLTIDFYSEGTQMS